MRWPDFHIVHDLIWIKMVYGIFYYVLCHIMFSDVLCCYVLLGCDVT